MRLVLIVAVCLMIAIIPGEASSNSVPDPQPSVTASIGGSVSCFRGPALTINCDADANAKAVGKGIGAVVQFTAPIEFTVSLAGYHTTHTLAGTCTVGGFDCTTTDNWNFQQMGTQCTGTASECAQICPTGNVKGTNTATSTNAVGIATDTASLNKNSQVCFA